MELIVGETGQLAATVAPADATDKSVTWSSSNGSVASVDASGRVTAVSAGSATITVKTEDGGKTATCAVTVKNPIVHVTGVTLNRDVMDLYVGDTGQLKATVTPEDATDKSVTWQSSDNAVATVDAGGLVTARSSGSAYIRVYTKDLGFTAACRVRVALFIAVEKVPVVDIQQRDTSRIAVGKTLQVGEICYFPSTLLLEVRDSDAGLSYDAFPKFYAENRSSLDKIYVVKKVWADDEAGNIARPVNVTVDLYEDGTLRDTVTLSEENKWQYRWESLDVTSSWTVAEREIPVNYEVMIDYNSQQYVIRNSYKPTTEVTTIVTTVSTQTTTTSAPQTTTIPTTAKERLVQTGQLWWPVLPLSVGGVLLIGTGISVKDGKKKDEE